MEIPRSNAGIVEKTKMLQDYFVDHQKKFGDSKKIRTFALPTAGFV